ncbi:MAG: glycosyltransferase family 4 protein, partial [Candidatus Eremiobacteraeota bacterium]|nr:glycosyltransferase family 4 protein [Candidatus Eremiobacteraeota bacterium]
MNSDPQILFIDYTGELAGGQLCLADIAIDLRNRCQVFLFESGPFQQLLEKNGVTVRLAEGQPSTLKVRKRSSWFAYLASGPVMAALVLRLARTARHFDLLYANTAKALMVAIPVALLQRKPLLVHLHDIIGAQHFNRLNSWLVVTGANLANGIVSNSEASAAAYRKAGGKNRNLKVIPNGFAVERFETNVSAASQALRKSLGAEHRALVGLFGRIASWKGQKVLIEALSKLPDVIGVVVGDALFTGEDQQYKRELLILAQKLGVRDRLQLVGFQTDILPYLRAVDVVVHCSTSPEPFGRVIVEAQLAGKPVIATKGGGPSEIIENRVTGILVNPNDPSELGEEIRELLGKPEFAAELASNGRQAAIRRFGLDSVLKKWVAFIDRTVTGAARNSGKAQYSDTP